MKSFIHFIEESPLAQLIDKHKNQFEFLHAATQQLRTGKLKLKKRGAANTRELAAAWKRRKKLREGVYFDSSDVEGTGAFSSRDIPKGTHIGLFLRKVEDNPHRTFVRSDLCRLMNHSSSPNADLVMKGDDAYVVSNKPIKKDEEIFVNYNDIMDKVQADEIKKNEFVRLYPDVNRERLEDDNEDLYDDLKSLRYK